MKIQGLDSGQVLQRLGARGGNVRLVGEGGKPGPVVVTLHDRAGALRGWKAKRVAVAPSSKFVVMLKNIPVGGPYRLEIRCGSDVARVESFYVGDVWVLAGQSNMEGCGNMENAAQTHRLVRCFSMRREWRLAEDPLHIRPESPDRCHHDVRQVSPREAERLRRDALKGTGPGLPFGREMLKLSGVPQGLIAAAHGGTSMSQWDPQRRAASGLSLFGSMIESVRATGQPVAGVLWYQGESDAYAKDVPHYTARMKKLVVATRRILKQPALPWLVVQISRVYGTHPVEEVEAWGGIREEQRLLPDRIPHLETVSAIDLALDDPIHIGGAGCAQLGQRLAIAAAGFAYQKKRRFLPRFRAIRPPRVSKSHGYYMDVAFDGIIDGLCAEGLPSGFAILDADHRIAAPIYKIDLRDSVVRLYIDQQHPPKAGNFLWYGHGIMPVCNITEGRGLALPAFGPVSIGEAVNLLPFLMEWKVRHEPRPPAALGEIPQPNLDQPDSVLRTYTTGGMANEHPRWQDQSGHGYFASELTLPKAERLDFLMGYDGPFRLWVDGRLFFEDLKGTNPCLPDERRKVLRLSAGTHDIRVAMDLNDGRAWGFFLRFARIGKGAQ